jgi:hypothetical protein
LLDPSTHRPKPKQAITLQDVLLAFDPFFTQATVFVADPVPTVRFPSVSAVSASKLAAFRRKDWSTSTSWNPLAEECGIYAEAALQKFLGMPMQEAAQAFLTGLQGDSGYDHIWQGKKIDQKGTMGQACRFKFSKSNKFRAVAEIFSFAWVEAVGQEYWVHLLGWAYRSDIRPFVRDDGRCFVVNFATLQREGLIKPIHQFQTPHDTAQTVTNPLITNQ